MPPHESSAPLKRKGKQSLEIISKWGIPETVSGLLDAIIVAG